MPLPPPRLGKRDVAECPSQRPGLGRDRNRVLEVGARLRVEVEAQLVWVVGFLRCARRARVEVIVPICAHQPPGESRSGYLFRRGGPGTRSRWSARSRSPSGALSEMKAFAAAPLARRHRIPGGRPSPSFEASSPAPRARREASLDLQVSNSTIWSFSSPPRCARSRKSHAIAARLRGGAPAASRSFRRPSPARRQVWAHPAPAGFGAHLRAAPFQQPKKGDDPCRPTNHVTLAIRVANYRTSVCEGGGVKGPSPRGRLPRCASHATSRKA